MGRWKVQSAAARRTAVGRAALNINRYYHTPASSSLGKLMTDGGTTAFPYRLSRRVVAFGGHDSWLREIKFKVPDVRFMGENISNAEIIRRADVIWIQTNCIGHAAYYGIINLARRYNRKVRYFQYASAAKCAEQIAEEEEKSKK